MKCLTLLLAVSVSTLVTGCAPSSSTATGDAPVAAASFNSDIKPLLEARCGKCHIEGAKGDLSLASLEVALAGGKSGPVILPGDAEHSLLYRMIAADPEVKRMPPKGEPLNAEELAAIKAWIDAGAN